MELLRIIKLHNSSWSFSDIIILIILLIGAAVYCGILVKKKKLEKLQALSGVLLLAFLGIVFGSTVFTRETLGGRFYELEVFWSWREALSGDAVALEEILLNMVLLFPAGFLLPFFFYRKVSWWQALIIGVIISAGIEVCQLIFCRGLFEWDDMIHNGLGCMAGGVAGSLSLRGFFHFYQTWQEQKERVK